jgi:hypothetical protein
LGYPRLGRPARTSSHAIEVVEEIEHGVGKVKGKKGQKIKV